MATTIKTSKATYTVTGVEVPASGPTRIIVRQASGKRRFITRAEAGRPRFDAALAHYFAQRRHG